MEEYNIIGKNVSTVDNLEKVVGSALYIDDMVMPDMLYGKILGSRYSHAKIRHIDGSKANRITGVKAVITAEDLPEGLYGAFIKDEPMLARDKIRYIGEPVAAVAAVDLKTRRRPWTSFG